MTDHFHQTVEKATEEENTNIFGGGLGTGK